MLLFFQRVHVTEDYKILINQQQTIVCSSLWLHYHITFFTDATSSYLQPVSSEQTDNDTGIYEYATIPDVEKQNQTSPCMIQIDEILFDIITQYI